LGPSASSEERKSSPLPLSNARRQLSALQPGPYTTAGGNTARLVCVEDVTKVLLGIEVLVFAEDAELEELVDALLEEEDKADEELREALLIENEDE
jgi:hypothetical protein